MKYSIYRNEGRRCRVLDVLVAHRGGMEFVMADHLGGHRPVELSRVAATAIARAIGDCYVAVAGKIIADAEATKNP